MFIKDWILSSYKLFIISLMGMANVFALDNLSSEHPQSEIRSSLNAYKRPDNLQSCIDSTFRDLSSKRPQWNYNGSSSYSMVKVDCAQILCALIKHSPVNKEFYVLDIGAGDFSWGNRTVDYINEQSELPSNLMVHVISLTGECYGGPSIETRGKCKKYNIDRFKIENLDQSIRQLKVELNLTIDNDFDLIVSSYTFIHLHDPVGTFIQAYNLLRPGHGIIMCHGFPVYYGPEEHYSLSLPFIEFLFNTSIPCLVDYGGGRDICPLLMKRPNNKYLSVPLEYAGTTTVRVANASSKPIANFRQINGWKFPSINLPTWQKGAIHGDRDLFEWIWSYYPEWQTSRIVWQPLFVSEEEGKINEVIKLPPPIFHAVNSGDEIALKNLLTEEMDVNQRNAMGLPLIFTTYNKKLQILIMRHKGFDFNSVNNIGQYVIHHVEGIALACYLEEKVNVNAQDRQGDTALHKAIRDAKYSQRRLKDISLLLQNGAITTIRNGKGQMAFELEEAKIPAIAEIIKEFEHYK